jgi:23S rRNA U2552 (ribose-2'-O)-methylase RlmE/FtsJ
LISLSKITSRLGINVTRQLSAKDREKMESLAFADAQDIEVDIATNYGFKGELLSLFVKKSQFPIHKWHHYIPIYDSYFSAYRGTNVRFLEIGVSKGGSLRLWRDYFGPDAKIFGIDIDPTCSDFDGVNGQVRIGSQDDSKFLKSVIDEMGGVDIVLDDGSHQMKHIKKTLQILFPEVSNSGLYVIEDLHTSFWKSFGGGNSRDNFLMKFLPELVLDMHRWYHPVPPVHPTISRDLPAIHIHDSIVVLEKGPVHRPSHSIVG